MPQGFITRLSILALMMTLPLWGILYFKWPISSDYVFYATALKSFSSQFWAGDIYPRWLTDTNSGYGSPVFLFYSPLTFYVGSVFEFLAPIDSHGFGRVVCIFMVSVMVSGICCRRWLRQTLPADRAETGALLYAGFPYLLLHMYGGFAAAQLMGIALFPLLLETAGLMVRIGWKAMPAMIVTYTLLCCAHLPSAVMFAGVPPLYVMVFSPKGKHALGAVLAGISALLGIALAGICLIPTYLNKPFITVKHFLDENLVFSNNFLDTYSLLGMVCTVLPLVVIYFELPKGFRRASLTPQMKFWIALDAWYFFLTLPISKPVWNIVTPMQHLQFPFRFYLAMLPGAVFIALHWLPQARSRNVYHMLFAIGLFCAAIYSEEIVFFSRPSPVASILDHHLLPRPEYQTRWMEREGIDFRLHVPDEFIERDPVTFVSGSGHVTLIGQDSRTIRLHADITTPEAKVTLPRFYFPGWEMEPVGVVSEYKALVAITLKQGEYDVTLSVPWFAGEREGMILGLGALILLMALFAFTRLQPPENGHIT